MSFTGAGNKAACRAPAGDAPPGAGNKAAERTDTMTNEKAFEMIRDMVKKANAFHHAMGILVYDAETVAPEMAGEGRGRTLSFLGDLEYEMITDPELTDAINYLKDHKDEFGESERREIDLTAKMVESVAKIPKDEYLEWIVLQDEASFVWKKAKESNDFALFEPYLARIIEMNRKKAAYFAPEKDVYDALLDIYEEGLTTEFCDKFFDELKEGLIPLIREVAAAPKIDDSFLDRICPADEQRRFTNVICEMMGLDMKRTALGEVEHPFTENFNRCDVRVTTHYYEDNFTFSMYSVLHEGGHAMYELNCDPKYDYTIFSGGVSMGIHESQSRFYENIVGRSEAFTARLLDAAKKAFPGRLDDVTPEMFFKAVNKSEPGLIRVNADELTYCMHIIIRYEIEKQLMAGTLATKDAPAVWADLYEKYLGICPETDTVGILQDSHWSGGAIGYFPTYALGSAYGAQMLARMLEDEPDLWNKVAAGDLTPVTDWLRGHIHRHASYYTPAALFENACGEFSPKYFINYLREKYTKVYGL